MNVLFISPHPDDAEIGCGGFIRTLIERGDSVSIAVAVGEGDLTMVHSEQTVLFSQRRFEQRKAASMLGVSNDNIIFMELAGAPFLDTIPLFKGVKAMDSILSNDVFSHVFIPLPSHNQDHKYVWDVMMAATRPSKAVSVNVYAYEQPTQFHGEQLGGSIVGRSYVPFSKDILDIKMKTLMCYESQMGGREDSIVSLQGVEVLAKMRGLEIEMPYAEMFIPIRTFI